ncbi:MAG TPA: hypothetical protein HA258_05370 [Thermoplasmata archaeon]|jgi:hypothetical protein|nr:hypothetical protein [Thermoplasmata archaeon]HIH28279.1 hypothetical protein [Thermoplasmata archaeon]
MKQTKKGALLLCMLLLFAIIVPLAGADPIPQTHLFLSIDTQWEHANPGDVFVVRADVKNIGDATAFLIQVQLQDIPDDWIVNDPGFPWILVLEPGQSKPLFFVVERGQTDATIYAEAVAYNAPVMISNRIPIPVELAVVGALCLIGSVLFYREAALRKKQPR